MSGNATYQELTAIVGKIRARLLDSGRTGRQRPYLPDFWGNVGRHVNQMIQASQLVMEDFFCVATSVPSKMLKEV